MHFGPNPHFTNQQIEDQLLSKVPVALIEGKSIPRLLVGPFSTVKKTNKQNNNNNMVKHWIEFEEVTWQEIF